jgi:hypothetical protein
MFPERLRDRVSGKISEMRMRCVLWLVSCNPAQPKQVLNILVPFLNIKQGS